MPGENAIKHHCLITPTTQISRVKISGTHPTSPDVTGHHGASLDVALLERQKINVFTAQLTWQPRSEDAILCSTQRWQNSGLERKGWSWWLSRKIQNIWDSEGNVPAVHSILHSASKQWTYVIYCGIKAAIFSWWHHLLDFTLCPTNLFYCSRAIYCDLSTVYDIGKCFFSTRSIGREFHLSRFTAFHHLEVHHGVHLGAPPGLLHQ